MKLKHDFGERCTTTAKEYMHISSNTWHNPDDPQWAIASFNFLVIKLAAFSACQNIYPFEAIIFYHYRFVTHGEEIISPVGLSNPLKHWNCHTHLAFKFHNFDRISRLWRAKTALLRCLEKLFLPLKWWNHLHADLRQLFSTFWGARCGIKLHQQPKVNTNTCEISCQRNEFRDTANNLNYGRFSECIKPTGILHTVKA